MIDDEFDDLLQDATHSYNAPPEPPREAMWEAISRARAASSVMPIAPARRRPRWVAAAGIAAVLVAGFAIGRASRGPSVTPTVVATTTLARPHTSDEAPDDSLPVAPGPTPEQTPVGPPSATRQVAAIRPATRGLPATQARAERSAATADMSGEATAYRFAVVEHLTRTEVLLTDFRAQARSVSDAQLAAQFKTLSRELLGTTRFLLATHRNDDPAITRLLEDLEFVLMQLSQYANDGRRVDLDALNQSIDKRNVLPKLRSTIPADATSAGT